MSVDDVLGLPIPWPAPAKLNLCLHIVGRRSDGYHLLQSAIQFIDLCDEMTFHDRPAGVIERISGASDVPADRDLVVRAATALAEHTKVARGVGIALNKRIPMQAGLGGGSSDAATVLVALNELWELHLPIGELSELGLTLGADVPVFVRGCAAWVEGVGEQLTAQDFPEAHYVVLKPSANISTVEIFQAAELTRNSPITTIRAFLAGGGRNDCTSTVRGRYPDVAEALDWLGNFGSAKLTGTGACVFAEVRDQSVGAEILAQLPARWQGFLVRSVNRSPLLDRLAEERNLD